MIKIRINLKKYSKPLKSLDFSGLLVAGGKRPPCGKLSAAIKRKVRRYTEESQVNPYPTDRYSGQIFYIQPYIWTAHRVNSVILSAVGAAAAPAAGRTDHHGNGGSGFNLPGLKDFLVRSWG